MRPSHRASPPPDVRSAEPIPDVLCSGSDEGSWRDPGRRRLLTGGLALAVGLAAAASLVPREGPSAGTDEVRLALHPRAVVVPRHVPLSSGRPAVAGVHVEVINQGRRPVVLTSAALVPGTWQVSVIDRTRLEPGWSAVLALQREVDCARGADLGAVPRELVLEVEADGESLVGHVDVGPAQLAYGGQLDDVLRSPRDACAPEAGLPLLGPIGDLLAARARRPPGI